ncbi:MAG: hemolysin III family protein, partial [Clostridiales bacterium]|nr:hemolysin III family protein [Clostridiales bacterium]
MKKKRTKLADRAMPKYTAKEEMLNMITHIVGGAFAVGVLIICLVTVFTRGNVWSKIGGSIYGVSLVALYTVSSVYHGLNAGKGKKVMRIIDHCTIYFLIAGTYTPILLVSVREVAPITSWVIFGVIWGLSFLAITLTAIDLDK